MFQVPGVCNHNPETTVLVHSDRLKHGNGWGTKGHDFHAAAGCSSCHQWYGDKKGSADEREAVFDAAHSRWWRWLLETGKVVVR